MYEAVSVSILVIVLAIAAYFDIKERRIPNKLTLPAILLGLISNSINSGFKGFQFSLIGLVFGIAVFFVPFSMNGMGAGDVKLMGAVGSFMGWRLTANSALYTAIIGGTIAIGFLSFRFVQRRKDSKLNKDPEENNEKKKDYIPYGVAIAMGTFSVLIGVFPGFIK